MKKPLKNAVQEKCLRAIALKAKLEGYRKDFDELDALTIELKDEKELATHGVCVVDNFAEKNTCWGHGSVRRFELKVLKCAK